MEDLKSIFKSIPDSLDRPGRVYLFSSYSYWTACFIISIGLPLTLLAICALYSLVKDNNVAPIYVINLLVSDLIQMCCLVVWVAETHRNGNHISGVSLIIYSMGVMVSIGFMVCVATERYLVIACPLWYRFRRSIKVSVVICIMVWISSFVLAFLDFFISYFYGDFILLSIFLLPPFPLLIFFLVGTLKALSSSISVPPEEKRRIVATLVLVLLNYTLLFLPTIIWFLQTITNNIIISDFNLCFQFIQISPLVDLVLYVFMRKGAVDKLLACLCRCRMSREQEQGQISTVSGNTIDMVSSMQAEEDGVREGV